jgi:hypothetical protein
MVHRVMLQKASLNSDPVPIPGGGGSVLTQHQSHDPEMDSQCNTRDGSSGRPGTVLEISYFTDGFAVHNILNIILGLGRLQIASIDSWQYYQTMCSFFLNVMIF